MEWLKLKGGWVFFLALSYITAAFEGVGERNYVNFAPALSEFLDVTKSQGIGQKGGVVHNFFFLRRSRSNGYVSNELTTLGIGRRWAGLICSFDRFFN